MHRTLPALALWLLALPSCSTSDPTQGNAGAGGSTATGGAAQGAGTNTGGKASNPAGGTPGSGGASAGATTTGGAATGGVTSTGGLAGGGSPATGGSQGPGGAATGGAPGGGAASGGTSNAGGAGGSAPNVGCDAAKTVASMKLGWNLGNSLDSIDAGKSDATVETAWGNPIITPALLGAVAAAGFGAVRIPVTWIGRFGAAPEYPISPTFMNRVEEVVNYALDRNLYVIINLHHDGAEGVDGEWITLVDASGQVTDANQAAVLAQFRKMWTQIAARFEDYGDHLIFEGMNEIKVGYDAPLPSYLDQVNELNQAFVDTIRAGSGYNPQRCLVVPGYNTNIDHTVAGFVKPTDTAPGKLILSDHYYDPWSFAGEGSTRAWGTGNPGIDDWGQEDWVQTQVAKLKSTFIDQGLPMIWGEYGAVNQEGSANYRRYYMEYVTKAVHDAGITPFVWDNGAMAAGAEGFGLINRSNNSVQYPELVEALVRAVTSDYSLTDVAKP